MLIPVDMCTLHSAASQLGAQHNVPRVQPIPSKGPSTCRKALLPDDRVVQIRGRAGPLRASIRFRMVFSRVATFGSLGGAATATPPLVLEPKLVGAGAAFAAELGAEVLASILEDFGQGTASSPEDESVRPAWLPALLLLTAPPFAAPSSSSPTACPHQLCGTCLGVAELTAGNVGMIHHYNLSPQYGSQMECLQHSVAAFGLAAVSKVDKDKADPSRPCRRSATVLPCDEDVLAKTTLPARLQPGPVPCHHNPCVML